LKSDGAPAVASRWLQRLNQLTRGLQLDQRLKPATPFAELARTVNQVGPAKPIKPPAPTPPVATRPRRLSVTEIETWLRDPYAIYAKHVLRLRALDPLEAEIGPMERGSILHKSLELFVRKYPHDLPANPAAELAAIAEGVFAEAHLPKAVLALWRPRFLRAVLWFAEVEAGRRAAIAESFVEISGQKDFDGPAGSFRLVGKADRIDRLKASGAVILDYKTGAPPSEKQVVAQLSPQLPLEAAILAAGGFKEIGPEKAAELIYIRLTGGTPSGEYRPLKADAMTLAADAEARLIKRIALFDEEATAYDSRVAPMFAKGEGDFDHLARVREWSMSGWGEEA
ncbi:MAG: PD-(D/E)XK nuclease family protein, partial [Rhizomicrobium sp.]